MYMYFQFFFKYLYYILHVKHGVNTQLRLMKFMKLKWPNKNILKMVWIHSYQPTLQC